MWRWTQYWRKLRSVLSHGRAESELAREVASHLTLLEDAFRDRGMTPAAARFAARRAFGGVEQAKELHRNARSFVWLHDAGRDGRYALRMLRRTPTFTAVVMLTLAVGIAANTTVFTFLNAVLLRTLPFPDADRLVSITSRNLVRGQDVFVSYPDFQAWRTAATSFSDMGAFNLVLNTMNVSDEGRPPERHVGSWVTANTFRLLGTQPLFGRDFAPDDDRRGAQPVVILGYGIWQTRYAADPSVLGRPIRINESAATVIGVMPEGMQFPYNVELWQPLVPSSVEAPEQREARGLLVFGRLRPGIGRSQARAEMSGIADRLAHQYPDSNKNFGVSVVSLNERFVMPPMRLGLLMLMGAVSFVLAIACANVANLLLSHAATRAHEMGVRVAMGATRWRIVRQLLVESVLLSAAGGGVGLVVSMISVRLAARTTTEVFPYWMHFSMDGRVFAFCALICVGTSVLSGLLPALHVSKTGVDQVLKDSSRTSTGTVRTRRFTGAMVAAELALAMVLLTGAGLMVRSLLALYRIDAGMNTDRLLTMRIDLPAPKYPTPAQRIDFHQGLAERLTAVPGVEAATVASRLPLGGGLTRGVVVDGVAPSVGERLADVTVVTIGPDYFLTCGLAMRRGRAFRDTDGQPGVGSAIVNERFVARFFPRTEPIGRRIQLRARDDQTAPWLTIVGVSPTVRQSWHDLEPEAVVYMPYRQDPAPAMAVIVRTQGPPGALTPVLRDEVRAIDPDLPVFNIRTVDQAFAEDDRRFYAAFTSLLTLFALVALGLSAVGLFAVTAHGVAQRTQEIGLRMALGAAPRQVRWLVLRRASIQMAIGLPIGLGAALALSRILILAQISPADPLTMLSVGALFAGVSLTAALIPANRAMQLDPFVALRYE